MRAEAALLPAPEVVGDPERRHRQEARLLDGDDPADERQPQAAMVSALRPEREQDVAELATAVEEAAQVAAGGAVLQVDRGFGDRQALLCRVRRHRRLATEAGREREELRPRAG